MKVFTEAEIKEQIRGLSQEQFFDILSSLPERMQTTLKMRYAIDYPEECTFVKIGQALGVCAQQATTIHNKALKSFKQKVKTFNFLSKKA